MPNEDENTVGGSPCRKPIGKRKRFEVFKRDKFTCQYCGRTPPAVTLQIDHINPVAGGGDNQIENLICACSDCNSGKSDVPLDSIPQSLIDKVEVLKERRDQLKAYNLMLRKQRSQRDRDVESVCEVFKNAFDGFVISTHFRRTSLETFLDRLPVEEVISAMMMGVRRFPDDRDRAVKYFCGVCWAKIKGDGREKRGW